MVRPPHFDMQHRRSTIFSSRRISSFFSRRLTPVTDQVDRRASGPARLPIPTAPESRSSKDSSRGGLHDVLDSAIPAELPTKPYLIFENKDPALRSLRTDGDVGDGLWICCHCHHENILRYWKDRIRSNISAAIAAPASCVGTVTRPKSSRSGHSE
jgi:hypothetical protein